MGRIGFLIFVITETNDTESGTTTLDLIQKYSEIINLEHHEVCFWKKLVSVAVDQLVEWSLPTPKVSDSNAVNDKINIEHLFTIDCFEKVSAVHSAKSTKNALVTDCT